MPITDTLRLRAEWGGDGTAAGLGQIETKLHAVDTAGKAAAQGTAQAAQSMTGMQRAGQVLTNTLTGLFGAYLGYRGVRMLIDFGVEVEHLASRVSATSVALAAQLRPASIGVADALKQMREASLGTVPDVMLLTRTTDAMRRLESSGIATAKGFEFVAEAQKFATLSMLAYGRDATQTFEMLVAGVAKGQPRYLQALGIMVDEHRLLSAEMTDSQRAGVLLELTMGAMGREFAATGERIKDTKSWIDELGTAWTNFKTMFGQVWVGERQMERAVAGRMSEAELRRLSVTAARRGVIPAEDPYYQELLARGREAIATAARAAAVAEVQANAVRDAAAKLAADLKKAADAVAAEEWLKTNRALVEFTYGLRNVAFRMAAWLPPTGPGLRGGPGFAFPTGPPADLTEREQRALEWQGQPAWRRFGGRYSDFSTAFGKAIIPEGGLAGAMGAQMGGMAFSAAMQAAMLPVTMAMTTGINLAFSGVGGALSDIFGIGGDAAKMQLEAARKMVSAAESQQRVSMFSYKAQLAQAAGMSEAEQRRLTGMAAFYAGPEYQSAEGFKAFLAIQQGNLAEAIEMIRQGIQEGGWMWGMPSDIGQAILTWYKEQTDALKDNTAALKDLTRAQEDVWEAYRRAEASALMLAERSEWGRQGVYQTYMQGGGIGGAAAALPYSPASIPLTTVPPGPVIPFPGPDEEYDPGYDPSMRASRRPARLIIEIHSGGDVVEQVVDASQTGRITVDRHGRLTRSRYA